MPVIYRIPGKNVGTVEFHPKKGDATRRLTKTFGRGHGKAPEQLKVRSREELCALLNNPVEWDPELSEFL